MKILITGTPGTGKTTLAKKLAKKFGLKYFNELKFAKKEKICRWNSREKEFEISVEKLQSAVKKLLEKGKKVIFEGHVCSEIRCRFDLVIVLTCTSGGGERKSSHDSKNLKGLGALELRLRKRKYPEVKIMDNLLAERQGYCRKYILRHYSNNKIAEIDSSGKNAARVALLAEKEIRKRMKT